MNAANADPAAGTSGARSTARAAARVRSRSRGPTARTVLADRKVPAAPAAPAASAVPVPAKASAVRVAGMAPRRAVVVPVGTVVRAWAVPAVPAGRVAPKAWAGEMDATDAVRAVSAAATTVAAPAAPRRPSRSVSRGSRWRSST